MQINDIISGFRVTGVREIPDQAATMYEFCYDKNGAQLIWLDRDDSNMTFAISFKTLPENDTGVFHILEHSVLNGSEKYPLREPFVDLLKCSLQTFLNAMTFEDKTVFPVSSRNKKDFRNLVDVYADAVFHPLIYRKKETFLQEGWHEEWDRKTKTLSRNGVVYSEMKGSFASVDTQLMLELERALFPDTCYRYCSGGYPDAIPELTYEAFLDTHRRFYHPTNAKIILDGNVDLHDILPLLDSYLCAYDCSDAIPEIGEQKPVISELRFCDYDIGKEDDPTDKGVLAQGFVYGTCEDYEETYALQAICDVLCGTNEAPLQNAVLSKGLCEDISIDLDGAKYLYATITAKNVADGRLDELQAEIERVIQETVHDGLDRDQLNATLNAMEFSAREKDSGSTPRGIVNAVTILNTWLYEKDPSAGLIFGDVFDRLREKANTDYFTDLLRRVFLESSHRAAVYMRPSNTLGEEKSAAYEAKMSARAACMTDAEKDALAAQQERLLTLQKTPDTAEAAACLPKLKLSDLPEKCDGLHLRVGKLDTTTVYSVPIATSGILYYDLLFDVGDLTTDDISLLSFLCETLGEMKTDTHSVTELQTVLKSDLGGFSMNLESYGNMKQKDQTRSFLIVSCSVLASKCDRAAPLLREVLLRSEFSNRETLGQLLRQRKLEMRQSIRNRGNGYAVGRAGACFAQSAVFNEYSGGIEYYRWVCEWVDRFETDADLMINGLRRLQKTVFTKGRLTLCVTGVIGEDQNRRIIDVFPDGTAPVPTTLPLLPKRSQGFIIPSEIGFAAKCCSLGLIGEEFNGDYMLPLRILTYDYFWNVIRVQNGAYGAGMVLGRLGSVRFSTYRDPLPANSLQCFDGAAEYLRSHIPDRDSMESLIIGCVGDENPVRSPRVTGRFEILSTLTGANDAYIQQQYRALLEADSDSILHFADLLDRLMPLSVNCVVGNAELVEACKPEITEAI